MLSIALSIISLIVAIFSASYTWVKSQPSINIFDYENSFDREQNRISFKITNTSTVPIFIENIELTKNNNLVNELDFDIDKFDRDEHERKINAENQPVNYFGVTINPSINIRDSFFTPSLDRTSKISQVLLIPYDSVRFDTFVDDLPDQITIYTNKRLKYFSRKKSVSVKNK